MCVVLESKKNMPFLNAGIVDMLRSNTILGVVPLYRKKKDCKSFFAG